MSPETLHCVFSCNTQPISWDKFDGICSTLAVISTCILLQLLVLNPGIIFAQRNEKILSKWIFSNVLTTVNNSLNHTFRNFWKIKNIYQHYSIVRVAQSNTKTALPLLIEGKNRKLSPCHSLILDTDTNL